MLTRSCPRTSPTSLRGSSGRLLTLTSLLLSLAFGCANSSGSLGVVPGDPFNSDLRRVEEYIKLAVQDQEQTQHLRAWIREADRTIRANNAVRGIVADTEEDLPWLTRIWNRCLRIFTTR
jgi:hypothetical protein